MTTMTRGRGGRESAVSMKAIASRPRRKRGDQADAKQYFSQAFADALRDILREERRRFA